MLVRDSLLAELDHEMAVTRHVLERVPESSLSWRPHEKSFSLGGLAWHLSQLPHWGRQILDRDSYDLDTARASTHAVEAVSVTAVIDTFDRHVADVRRGLLDRADGQLQATWTLTRGGQTLVTMPRIAALRRFLLHHVIHHRGQMTVYLRLQGVAIPPIYGPTADERM